MNQRTDKGTSKQARDGRDERAGQKPKTRGKKEASRGRQRGRQNQGVATKETEGMATQRAQGTDSRTGKARAASAGSRRTKRTGVQGERTRNRDAKRTGVNAKASRTHNHGAERVDGDAKTASTRNARKRPAAGASYGRVQPSTAAEAARSSVRHTRKRRKKSPKQVARMRTVASSRRAGVVATAVLLACISLVGLMFFARPTTSAVENRALTAFPAPTWETFWNGAFFSDVALWYSDTYPLREQMVAANQTLDAAHGIKTDTQMVGGTKQADELPPADGASDKGDASSSQQTAPTVREKVEVPTEEEMAAAVQNQITEGLYVKGDAAYNIYYFSQDAVQEYASAINTLASELDGQATVYSMVVPNSSGVMLPDEEVQQLGGTNQVEALRYFYSLYDPSVRDVDAMGELRKHTDEYLYYRTDHHWSTLGSYYGYVAYCKKKGIEPENKDDLKYKNMGDYLGSFYSQLNSEEMAANPDYMDAWYPNATNELTLYDTDGTAEKYEIITDTSSADAFGKGLTHIMGDQPLEKIENPNLNDGSSVLVIKDSFGDSFAPWLVDHYQTVWIADFRYFEGSYKELVEENDIKDVLVLNNISLAGGGAVAPSILGKL